MHNRKRKFRTTVQFPFDNKLQFKLHSLCATSKSKFLFEFLLFILLIADMSATTKEPTVRIKCLSGSMLITIKDAPTSPDDDLFSGMIYPKGLSKNSTCLMEYR